MAGNRQRVSLLRFLSAASLAAAGAGSLAIAIIDFASAAIGPPKGHVAYYGCNLLALPNILAPLSLLIRTNDVGLVASVIRIHGERGWG